MNKEQIKELAKECDLEWIGEYKNEFQIPIKNLEAFAKAVINTYENEKNLDQWAKEKTAFAEGKTIEYKSIDNESTWKPITSPTWIPICQYRIKPQTETRWQWRTKIGNCCTTGWFAIAPNDYYCIKLEYTAQEFEIEVTE